MKITNDAQSDKVESIYIKSRVNEGNRKAAFKLMRMVVLALCIDAYFWIFEGRFFGAAIFSLVLLVVAVALYIETGSAYISNQVYRSRRGKRIILEQPLQNWQVLRVERESVFNNLFERLLRKSSYKTMLSFSMRHKNPPFADIPIPEIHFKDDDDPEMVVKMIKTIQDITGFDVVFNEEALAKWYPTYKKLYGDLEYKFADYKTLILA